MTQAQPNANDDDSPATFPLTNEHRMLLDIRDTLYDGSWEDFTSDLEARQQSQPHVFDTVPDSPGLLATIDTHLALIREMNRWEKTSGNTLKGKRA